MAYIEARRENNRVRAEEIAEKLKKSGYDTKVFQWGSKFIVATHNDIVPPGSAQLGYWREGESFSSAADATSYSAGAKNTGTPTYLKSMYGRMFVYLWTQGQIKNPPEHDPQECEDAQCKVCAATDPHMTEEGIAKPKAARKNPRTEVLTLIGESCKLIETSAGPIQGGMGRVLGRSDGAVIIEGLNLTRVKGHILAIEYQDDGKIVAEGETPDGRPWRHEFEAKYIRVKDIKLNFAGPSVGVLLIGDKPLWEMR